MKKGTGRPETGNFDPAIGSAAERTPTGGAGISTCARRKTNNQTKQGENSSILNQAFTRTAREGGCSTCSFCVSYYNTKILTCKIDCIRVKYKCILIYFWRYSRMTNLDIETFWAVVQHGTMTAAAEALYITQPTLSMRIRALEERVGTPLFLRGKGQRRIQLTEAGPAAGRVCSPRRTRSPSSGGASICASPRHTRRTSTSSPPSTAAFSRRATPRFSGSTPCARRTPPRACSTTSWISR